MNEIEKEKEEKISEEDDRKTIKVTKNSYVQLETIKKEMDFTTIMDTVTYVVNTYKSQKSFEEEIVKKERDFDMAIVKKLNDFAKETIDLISKFHSDMQGEYKKVPEKPKSEDKVISHF